MKPDELIQKIEECCSGKHPNICDCDKNVLEYRDFILDAFAIKLVNAGIFNHGQDTDILNKMLKEFKGEQK